MARYLDPKNDFVFRRIFGETVYSRMETDVPCQQISEDLLADELIRKAVELCKEDNFTEEELADYDRWWDSVRIEKGKQEAIENILAQTQKR